MDCKITIYSCNIGGYDKVRPICYPSKDINYVYFTDSVDKAEGWKKIRINSNNSPRITARFYKINPHLVLKDHKEGDISVWIDSSFFIRSINRVDIENALKNKDIACFKHGSRMSRHICAYREAEICMKADLDDRNVITDQVNRYRREGFKENMGLYSTGFIIRRNTDKIRKFNEVWWDEVSGYSVRDQISQTYSAWKTGV